MGIIIGAELSSRLMEFLRGHRVVYVATVDPQGWPDAAPITWVTAISPRIIRMAIASGVATIANIRDNGRVRISLLGGNVTVSIKGKARILKEPMQSVSVTTTMVEVEVTEVKDDGFWGRNDITGLATPWAQRRQVASDIAIIAELRNEFPQTSL